MSIGPLTTQEAANLVGLPRDQFRSAMTKARRRGVECRRPRDEWPDARTPLWDADAVEAWKAARR